MSERVKNYKKCLKCGHIYNVPWYQWSDKYICPYCAKNKEWLKYGEVKKTK